jgi:rubrerythrin
MSKPLFRESKSPNDLIFSTESIREGTESVKAFMNKNPWFQGQVWQCTSCNPSYSEDEDPKNCG